VEENEAQDPIDPWLRIGGNDGSALLSTRPGKLAKISADPPAPEPTSGASAAPKATTSSPMRAGGVLKTLGNPFANRSAFSRSRANLFGKTFLVRTIVRAASACSAKVGWDRPSERGSDCCAKIHPGSKIARTFIDKSLIDMCVFKGEFLIKLTKFIEPE
jgi:hypothetical protein